MPAWVYRARDSGGRYVRGRTEAENERDVISRLRNQGYLILNIDKDRDLQAMMQQQGGFFAKQISKADLVMFSRQFATMINAGLPVVTALKVLSRQSANPRLRRALSQVAFDVEAGEGLGTAFARQGTSFSTVMVQMIAAGEVGGILDEVLNRLAAYLEKEETIRQKVKSALVYPSIISVVAGALVVFLMVYVVPQFVQVYAEMEAELPWITAAVVRLSDFVKTFWWGAFALIAGAVLFLRYARRTERGAQLWDRMLLRLPVFGPLVTKQCIARFARTLGDLLASGITILKALTVAERTVGNRTIAAVIRESVEEVRQGQNLTVPLQRSGVFPAMVLEMISVGEETGTVEEMFKKVADYYEEEVLRTAERLSSLLEPLILVVLAVTIGLIITSMMVPVFNLWTMVE